MIDTTYIKHRNNSLTPQGAKSISVKQAETIRGRSTSLRYQKVYPKLVKKHVHTHNTSIHSTPLLQKIKQKSRIVLVPVGIIALFFLTVPLVMNVQSYMWEKQRSLELDSDPLYDIFLVEGLGIETDRSLDAGQHYDLPSLVTKAYTVKKGDSLFAIARRFNVSIDTIISANNLKNGYYLGIGVRLKIPNISGVYYRVRKGDSLSSIAARYRVDFTRIADINDIQSAVIHVDDLLFIPGGTLSSWERAVALGDLFKKPTKGRLTSRMGFRKDPFTGRRAYHAGIDIANRTGTPVVASQSGRVVYAGYRGNYGKTVILRHPQGYVTIYAHLHKIYVKRSQSVKQGEQIGSIGNTGRSTGPHLHFEIHQYSKLLDPMKILHM